MKLFTGTSSRSELRKLSSICRVEFRFAFSNEKELKTLTDPAGELPVPRLVDRPCDAERKCTAEKCHEELGRRPHSIGRSRDGNWIPLDVGEKAKFKNGLPRLGA